MVTQSCGLQGAGCRRWIFPSAGRDSWLGLVTIARNSRFSADSTICAKEEASSERSLPLPNTIQIIVHKGCRTICRQTICCGQNVAKTKCRRTECRRHIVVNTMVRSMSMKIFSTSSFSSKF